MTTMVIGIGACLAALAWLAIRAPARWRGRLAPVGLGAGGIALAVVSHFQTLGETRAAHAAVIRGLCESQIYEVHHIKLELESPHRDPLLEPAAYERLMGEWAGVQSGLLSLWSVCLGERPGCGWRHNLQPTPAYLDSLIRALQTGDPCAR